MRSRSVSWGLGCRRTSRRSSHRRHDGSHPAEAGFAPGGSANAVVVEINAVVARTHELRIGKKNGPATANYSASNFLT